MPPDRLAAEARRWIGQIGYSTEPTVITAVRAALERYYGDLVVIDGIVNWRITRRLKPATPLRHKRGPPPKDGPQPRTTTEGAARKRAATRSAHPTWK